MNKSNIEPLHKYFLASEDKETGWITLFFVNLDYSPFPKELQSFPDLAIFRKMIGGYYVVGRQYDGKLTLCTAKYDGVFKEYPTPYTLYELLSGRVPRAGEFPVVMVVEK